MAGGAAPASVLERIGARALDGVPLVIAGVAFAISQWDAIAEAIRTETEPELTVGWPWRLGWLLPFLSEVAFVRWFGGSLGKLVVGIRITDLEGERPSWASSTKRAFVYHLVPLSVLSVVLTSQLFGALSQVGQLALLVSIVAPEDRRGWHDRWSGTQVVRRGR